MNIILASTSRYRRALLERLRFDFRCVAPDVDETPVAGELPLDLATRLSRAKAREVANRFPAAMVIGSDQVASIDGRTAIGKPGSFEAARAQLRASSGTAVTFYTGVALNCAARGMERFHVELFSVQFRELSDRQIESYLRREQPYDCAGSFKAEGLGIALFEKMVGDDPSSLEGLPLIRLNQMLLREGLDALVPGT